MILFSATVIALVISNSPLAPLYFELWETELGIKAGNFLISMDLTHWIDDGLMAFFFMLVGLEIKREFLLGELAGMKRAAFPIVAAIGGMAAPVAVYLIINQNEPFGFGIPMATDIAFVLGILMLLGKRVPPSLKLFLISLAVVDDLGAVAVITIFYTGAISLNYLFLALVTYALIWALNLGGVKKLLPYLLLGVVLWIFIHKTGVHATVTGVLVALAIPIHSKLSEGSFVESCKRYLNEFAASGDAKPLLTQKQICALEGIAEKYDKVQNPLLRLEHYLHGVSAFVIMPLFAFSNAGVNLELGSINEHITLFWSIALGLFIGKPLGIFGFTYLADRLGIAKKPGGLDWSYILAGGFLGGIGFTMSIFVAQLAFEDHGTADAAKIAILGTSLVAAVAGTALLLKLGSARSADFKES